MFYGYPIENWIELAVYFIGAIIMFTTIYFVSDLLTEIYFTENKTDYKGIHKNSAR